MLKSYTQFLDIKFMKKNGLLATNLLHSNWTQLLRDLPDLLKKILQDKNATINITVSVVNL